MGVATGGKTLVVVDGPSGAGKSELLRWASERHEGVVAIPKLTTRPARGQELEGRWSDLIHVSEREFDDRAPDYVYSRNRYRYGFSRAHLLGRLAEARIGLLVVRDAGTVRRMIGDLPELRLVPLFIDAPRSVRAGRVNERLPAGESDPCPRDLYRRRILNDGSRERFRREVDALIGELSGP